MPKLTYFGAQGRAAMIRMLLTHAGVEFENHTVDQEGFAKLKADGILPTGKVPVYYDGDLTLNQSVAILRYVGRKYGYYPSEPLEAYNVDWIFDTGMDNFKFTVLPTLFNPNADEEAKKTFAEWAGNFWAWADKHLEGKKFFANEKISIADFWLYGLIRSIFFNENSLHKDLQAGNKEAVTKFANVAAWVELMDAENKKYLETEPKAPF